MYDGNIRKQLCLELQRGQEIQRKKIEIYIYKKNISAREGYRKKKQKTEKLRKLYKVIGMLHVIVNTWVFIYCEQKSI